MTRFRRSRLAGALVARGMGCHPACGRASKEQAVVVLAAPGLARSVILPQWQEDPRAAMRLGERQVRFNAGHVAFSNNASFGEVAFALRRLAFQQVPTPRLGAQNLAGAGHFEPLRDSLSRFASCN